VSRFLTDAVADAGRDAVCVPPIVDPAHHRVVTTRRTALFVNPVPAKGVERAIALARARPDIPFAFVRLWSIGDDALARLRRTAYELGNVELRETHPDPRTVYRDARVMLVPSVCQEAWGRVASEAQASGIPAIASAVGGLPEAVGDAGVLVEPDAGLEAWEQALSSLWDDPTAYGEYAERAHRRARRPDLSPTVIGDRFEALLDHGR
jgi:glycosyltransferase involved in cell wall biosynthesis